MKRLIPKTKRFKLVTGGLIEVVPHNPEIDWNTIKSSYRRVLNVDNMKYINNFLKGRVSDNQRQIILSLIMEESGGNPQALSDGSTYYGLVQWGKDRYNRNQDYKKTNLLMLDNQLNYLVNTLKNTTDSKSWTHGGTGSGYNSFRDAYNLWNNKNASDNLLAHSFTWGYVRPFDHANRIAHTLDNLKLIRSNIR